MVDSVKGRTKVEKYQQCDPLFIHAKQNVTVHLKQRGLCAVTSAVGRLKKMGKAGASSCTRDPNYIPCAQQVLI